MKRKYESIAIVVIIALAITVATVLAFNLLAGNPGQSTTNTTDSFIAQPVVDLIIPGLFRQSSTGGVNSPLNVTSNENLSILVQVYSTVDLNVTMQFQAYPLFSSPQQATSSSTASQNITALISATFSPASFHIGAEGKGDTTLHLTVVVSARPGSYSAVISAVNSDNATQVWGDVFQVNISQ